MRNANIVPCFVLELRLGTLFTEFLDLSLGA